MFRSIEMSRKQKMDTAYRSVKPNGRGNSQEAMNGEKSSQANSISIEVMKEGDPPSDYDMSEDENLVSVL